MSTTPAVQQDGPIVAVQYLSDENLSKSMTLKVGDGVVYAAQYAHLKQLATDDKAGYKELKAAIKHVAGLRTDNAKEEKFIKDPLNEFKNKVLALGKLLRGEIAPVEADLVAEKNRIDNIIADQLEAQRRLWNENLEMIRAKGNLRPGMEMGQLENELNIIDLCNLDDFDFGEYIEDAKAALANARIRVEMAIAQEDARLEIVEQQAEIARQQAEAAEKEAKRVAEQAAKDYASDWDMALAEDENRTLKALMRAASTPEIITDEIERRNTTTTKGFGELQYTPIDEVTNVVVHDDGSYSPKSECQASDESPKPEQAEVLRAIAGKDLEVDPDTAAVVRDGNNMVVGLSVGFKVPGLTIQELADGHMALAKASSAPPPTFDDEPAPPKICANDQLNLELFIRKLANVAKQAGRYESTVCTDAVASVINQLGEMQGFLTKVKEQ